MRGSLGNSGFYLSQAFDVLTNNLCKQSFLFVLAYFSASQISSLLMANLAITVYIIPFLFISYWAGRHAEHRNKRRLIRILKASDLALLTLVTLSYALHLPSLTLVMIFLLGCKTAIMTPVKFAYMSERYNGNALLRSNGLMQTLSLSCMLIAVTSAGFILDFLQSPSTFGVLLLGLSAAGLFSAMCMQDSASQVSPPATETSGFTTMTKRIARSALAPLMWAIAWFWFISAMFVSQFINFVKLELAGTALAAASALGIFVTGMLAGMALLETLKRHFHAALLPSGIMLSILTASIALYDSPSAGGVSHTDLLDRAAGLSLLLFATGVCATSYIAPLYTRLQSLAPATITARVMGLSSLLNAILIVLSTLFAFVLLQLLALPLTEYFMAISISNLLFFSIYALHQHRRKALHPKQVLLP